VVTDEERAATLVAAVSERVIVLDSERRLVAASPAAHELLGGIAPGTRVGEDVGGALVLFVGDLPELSAYQELRAGFTAAVSHELRTPLARLLVLLESATLPGARIDDLVERARQEVQQARDLIDDVLFLGELETGRAVVSLGRTRALPVLREVAAGLADRAEHAQVTLDVSGGDEIDVPIRPRMLRVVAENLIANAIRPRAPVRALLPRRHVAHLPRHRSRPCDREARGHIRRRHRRGRQRAGPWARDRVPLPGMT
jgi:signal transduction histidine kinase